MVNDEFKSMWEDGSPVRREWDRFELLSQTIRDRSRDLAMRALRLRRLPDIEADMRRENAEMEVLVLETLSVLWNRLRLRSCLKVSDSLELMVFSMNRANAYRCASAARSVTEHVALLHFFAREIPWHGSAVVQREPMIKFIKHIFTLTQGSTFDWDKLFSGEIRLRDLIASKEWKRPRDERIPQIASLVESLDKEMAPSVGPEGQMAFLYSCMSDVVHPSWGGDFI